MALLISPSSTPCSAAYLWNCTLFPKHPQLPPFAHVVSSAGMPSLFRSLQHSASFRQGLPQPHLLQKPCPDSSDGNESLFLPLCVSLCQARPCSSRSVPISLSPQGGDPIPLTAPKHDAWHRCRGAGMPSAGLCPGRLGHSLTSGSHASARITVNQRAC